MLEGLTLIIVAGTAHMIMDYIERSFENRRNRQ